jgi:hypothetical protein
MSQDTTTSEAVWWNPAPDTPPPLLRQVLGSGEPAEVQPLALVGLRALETWLHHSPNRTLVLPDLRAAVESGELWRLRWVILVALNCSDDLVIWLWQKSPTERKALLAFVDVLQRELHLMLRGGSDQGEGHCAKYSGPEDFTTRLALEYMRT